MVEDRSVAEQTHEIINLEHALADAGIKLPDKFLVMSIVDKFPKFWENFGMTLKYKKGRLSLDDLMIAISIEEEHRNQTHKMPVEHQPRAKTRPPKIRNLKQINHAGTMGRLDTRPSFVLIKRPRLGKQLSTWLWEVLAVLAPQEQLKDHHWKDKIPGIEVNTIVEFRDAVFLEDVFSMKTGIPSSVSLDDSLASTSIPEYVEKITNVGVNPNSTNLTHEESDIPKRSKRTRVVKDFGSDFVTYNIKDNPITFKMLWLLLKLSNGKKLSKMDVKTALLYGELNEEIYMDQPEGFVAHGNEHKDMGKADVILGIKLIRSIDGITISQSHYVEKIIEKFGYQNSRIAKTPYDSSIALFKNKSGVSIAQLRYSQIIGSLQYLANATRPDISFYVSKLARYTSCPDKTHWSALDRVLRYLKGTVSLVTHYGRFPTVL
ncbi:UNVERIFIED_CONTAM: Retrovirus-related Pol polyprotein from transposon TNT 1-94 [Sesamum calycinum]|uniref:Retrovirus-related Pol polyprotein from transposon TNT 1-94 n=1 Tax=Sesamum calycinum TaxID=2727403 RepID=A0AAW2LWU9_9LAMI